MPRGQSIRILRATAAGNSPGILEQGELAVDALSNPPRLYTGVPTARDPSGRIDLLGGSAGAAVAAVVVSATPPPLPEDGELWFDSSMLTMFVRYNDGTKSIWVPVVGLGVSGGNVPGGGLTLAEVEIAIANALLAYAPINSATLTGTPAAPTPPPGTNSTRLATTAFVAAAGFAPVNSATFTGTPSAPTPPAGNNSTRLATTEFVTSAIAAAPSATVGLWRDDIALSVAGAWVVTQTLLYRTVNNGKNIQFRGEMGGSSWGTHIFATLPAGYRPSVDLSGFIGRGRDASGIATLLAMDVLANGDVRVNAPALATNLAFDIFVPIGAVAAGQ